MLVSFLFLYTGLAKLFAWRHFRQDLYNQVFPPSWVPVLLFVVPVTEIGAALMLYFPKTRLAGWLLSLAMMLYFTAYTTLVLAGIFDRVPCSCGGVIRQLTWPQHEVLNIFFTVLILLQLKIFARETGEAENLQKRVGINESTKN